MDFRDSVFNTIRDIMRKDPAVMIVTNDMGAMVLDQIREEWPARVINVGIAEQNMMSVAGGLAQCGRKVFGFGIAAHVATRSWEQIKLDICALNLPVVIVGVGPGLAYGNDGPTHHATEDVSLMLALPNMAVYNPCDPISTILCTQQAYERGGPGYLRLDKESVTPVTALDDDISQGFKVLRDGKQATLLATGILTHRVLEAAELLDAQGIKVRVVDVFRLKPLTAQDLDQAIGKSARVFTIEEHNVANGFGAFIATHLATRGGPPLTILGLPDQFLFGSASRPWAHEQFGLTPAAIAATVQRTLSL